MQCFLVLGLLFLQAPAASQAPLVPLALRTKWRTVASGAAQAGDASLLEHLRGMLVELGDPPEELTRLDASWKRALAAAKPARNARAELAQRIERELPALAKELARLEGERRLGLARCMLALDAGQPEANAAFGRELDDEGEWLTPEARAWREGGRRLAALEHEARVLEFDCEEQESSNPTLLALGGGRLLRASGLELHSSLPPATLARVLTQTLRAISFSHALAGGPVEPVTGRFVLLDTEAAFERTLEESLGAGGISPALAEVVRRQGFRSYHDERGWRTIRWRPEAEFAAILLWDLSPAWLGTDTQPCLTSGHLNYVCLRLLGTSVPHVAWMETSASGGEERSNSGMKDVVRESLWRCARRSFIGCRSWLVRAVRAGTDPSWTRAMVDHEGKISGEALLKTTMVCELLHMEGRFRELCRETRGQGEIPAAMERALGEALPEFEARWRRWIDQERPSSVLERLAADAVPAGQTPFDAALLALSQARANANKGTPLEFPLVQHDEELARGAAAHARYLALNPEQRSAWPAAHEEYPGRPGYDSEGARAGANGLISLEATPELAVQRWLGTFYHRLPLLHPGLFGVGFAHEAGVVVADVNSLVLDPWADYVALWPMPDALDVPRAFQPEHPNPVPGSNMASLGYPVSVQLFFAVPKGPIRLELELWNGAPDDGKRVACHFISPDEPLFPELAPPDAWSLIPARALEPRTSYTAVARWNGATRRWSFTTAK